MAKDDDKKDDDKKPAKAPTTYAIATPNAGFRGVRAGVHFNEGKGETTDRDAAIVCAGFGYQVEPNPCPPPKAAAKK